MIDIIEDLEDIYKIEIDYYSKEMIRRYKIERKKMYIFGTDMDTYFWYSSIIVICLLLVGGYSCFKAVNVCNNDSVRKNAKKNKNK